MRCENVTASIFGRSQKKVQRRNRCFIERLTKKKTRLLKSNSFEHDCHRRESLYRLMLFIQDILTAEYWL